MKLVDKVRAEGLCFSKDTDFGHSFAQAVRAVEDYARWACLQGQIQAVRRGLVFYVENEDMSRQNVPTEEKRNSQIEKEMEKRPLT